MPLEGGVRQLPISAAGLRGRISSAVMLLLCLTLFPMEVMCQPAPARLGALLPDATRLGPLEGMPPIHQGWRGDTPVGFVFSSRQVTGGRAAGTRPLDLLIGLGLDCRITGVELVEHREPLFVTGVPEAALGDFVQRYVGLDIARRVQLGVAPPGEQAVQAISRATVSSNTLHDAILGAARLVARGRGLACIAAGRSSRLNLDAFEPETWATLRADDSIATLTVTAAEAATALRQAGAATNLAAPLPPGSNFITLYTALATPAQIGANLLGRAAHARLLSEAGPGSNLIFLAGDGFHSFRGRDWMRSGVFDRIQLVQGDRTVTLTAAQHHRLERLPIGGAPPLREISVFVLPHDSPFEPDRPWRIDLAIAEGGATALVSLPYALPGRHVLAPAQTEAAATEGEAVWRKTWQAQSGRIAILACALLALYTILALQDQVAARPRLWRGLRTGVLGFTLVWLGWYAGAQLSVVHVLTFVEAIRTSFHWDLFLAEPLTFILWAWVAVATAFWGRGVFCGWLCPFGALQDLMGRIGRAASLPQLRLPFALHERLLPTKYILFFGLFAISLGDMTLAFLASEVEPFRTAIVLRFMRWGPLLVYALAILAGALFVERAFCRYLCPLGAAIALPARLRMFTWLKRHRQCGTECHICALHCPVQAIHPNGEINPNECIHCLRCQVNYFDDQVCPPLIQRRQRRARREALQEQGAP